MLFTIWWCVVMVLAPCVLHPGYVLGGGLVAWSLGTIVVADITRRRCVYCRDWRAQFGTACSWHRKHLI